VASPGLHIGVDGRELTGRATGVGRYLAGILRAWAADAGLPHRVTVFVPADPPDTLARLPRIDWRVLPAAAAGTWWEQARLPGAVRRERVDAFFAAGYTAPLRLRCPTVLAVYDVSFAAHPEWFGWREGLRRRWLTRRSAQRAHTVISISAFSAGEIVRYLGIPRERIRLAPPGAPPARPARAGPPAPIVLFVGSLFTRRRLPELVGGFARLAADLPDARLVLVGDNRTRPPIDPAALARALNVASRVEWRRYASDVDLDALYASAGAFAFLSDYEGFAMTPLEAIAAGVPPVLLDTPVSREIYGDAALLVGPEPAAIAAALRTLLTEGDARARVVAAGRRLLDRHTWPAAAGVVLRALEEAARP